MQYDTIGLSNANDCGQAPGFADGSSSPVAPEVFDFDRSSGANSSRSMIVPFDDSLDFFEKDFDLSSTLTKEESKKEANTEVHDFFNIELMTSFGREDSAKQADEALANHQTRR